MLVGVGSGGEDLGGECDLLSITPYVIGVWRCWLQISRHEKSLAVLLVSYKSYHPFGRRLTEVVVLISKDEFERSEFALGMNLIDKEPTDKY